MDINDDNIIHANFKNVVEPVLCTKIRNESGVSVSTVEHLMAAFYGEGIDNALVEIDSPEVPIMDGSALDFVDAIRSVGIEEQNQPRKFIKVLKKVEFKEGEKFISIEPLNNDLIIDFELIYKNPLIRTRRKEFKLSNDDLSLIYSFILMKMILENIFCKKSDGDYRRVKIIEKQRIREKRKEFRSIQEVIDEAMKDKISDSDQV